MGEIIGYDKVYAESESFSIVSNSSRGRSMRKTSTLMSFRIIPKVSIRDIPRPLEVSNSHSRSVRASWLQSLLQLRSSAKRNRCKQRSRITVLGYAKCGARAQCRAVVEIAERKRREHQSLICRATAMPSFQADLIRALYRVKSAALIAQCGTLLGMACRFRFDWEFRAQQSNQWATDGMLQIASSIC